MKMRQILIAIGFVLSSIVVTQPALAEEGKDLDKLLVEFGGFVDTYYSYDFNRPPLRDRQYTTQPARHNEFNVNLASIEAKINAERLRGRLALQTGTSVQANYAGEPAQGLISGPNLSRHIQEAVLGYKVTDKFWIDGGIYLSHIGLESFISKDNWTYTRSLMADFSPYYETGVKASYQFNDQWSAQFHVINGWQNISENNGNKAVGTQVAFAPSDRLSFTYNNFWGNEASDRRRFFNDFIAKFKLSDALQLAAVYDIGIQRNAAGDGESTWQTVAVIMRYQLAPKVALAVRGEGYSDPDQVIVTTGSRNAFKTVSASLGADVNLYKNLMWRNEVRYFWSKNDSWASTDGNKMRDGFAVTSLSLAF